MTARDSRSPATLWRRPARPRWRSPAAAPSPRTEVGDEESLYEVEVTLADGSQTDVQLDQNFVVVGSKTDGPGADVEPDAPGN